MSRDPRVDPRPGDALKKKRNVRTVAEVSSPGQFFTLMRYRIASGELRGDSVEEWRKWAKNAEVIHVAD